MAKIIEITDQGNDKTFTVCLADKCSPSDQAHAASYHRTYTWSTADNPMTEEDMIREVKHLAAAEKARLDMPLATVRPVSINV